MEIDELFCKRYPEYSVNGKPLSPYFDVFEEGYEQAEKEYEEQIEHLREERNYFQEKCEDIELNYYCDHKGGCKVQELEKENAELREEVNILDNCNRLGDVITEAYKEQLTKATKFLNEFMRISKASDEDFEHDYSELIGETEQFLKEIEK